MQLRDALFSSESVTEGHPDKICDQVSDAVLDECLRQDKSSRVALETAVKTGLVILIGEITTRARLEYSNIVRRTVERIGFNDGSMGFDARSCAVMVAVEHQSPEIAVGVDSSASKEQGAGDQGMMFGYACDETPEMMPLPIALAHRLTRQLAKARRGELKFLRPDGKSQVTVEYRAGRPHKVQAVVIAAQHEDSVSTEHLREAVNAEVIDKVVPVELRAPDMKRMINATGRFIIGGPMGDSGVTGRKIIVDTYGGMGHHGGGAFSGKDPSKVDRSAAYGALGGEERRRRRAGAALRSAGRVCHRRRRTSLDHGGDVRDARGARGEDRKGGPRDVLAQAGLDHPRARSAPAHLREDRRIRALRPQRAGVHLGADRSRGRAAAGRGPQGRRVIEPGTPWNGVP